MKRSSAAVLAALILLSPAVALWAAKDEPAPAENKDIVGRFGGLRKTTYLNKSAALLNVMPASGMGAGMKMVVTDKDMIEFAQKCKPGDLLSLSYAKVGHDLLAGKVEAYDMKPGEDAPGVFVFSKSGTETVNKKDVAAVTVTKFGTETVLAVPLARNSEGKMAPKEELMKVIEGFKPGDLVEVKNAGTTLQSIKAYDAPQLGEFQKAEKAADSGLTTVDVKIGGDVQTLSIAKKDATLAANARKLKSGDLVYCRTTTDDKGTWLVELKQAPPGTKLPVAKPKKETTASKAADK
jgi:hypothetical protein